METGYLYLAGYPIEDRRGSLRSTRPTRLDERHMKTAGIQIRRFPYEEPYYLNLVFSASNGVFGGRLEYYCDASDLEDLGKALRCFPKKVPDEYSYEIGSTKPEDKFAYHFALHAYTTDGSGHCALQVVIDNNGARPDDTACRFSIGAEPSAINRFGELLIEFSKLKHDGLNWSVSGETDCLIETGNPGSPLDS